MIPSSKACPLGRNITYKHIQHFYTVNIYRIRVPLELYTVCIQYICVHAVRCMPAGQRNQLASYNSSHIELSFSVTIIFVDTLQNFTVRNTVHLNSWSDHSLMPPHWPRDLVCINTCTWSFPFMTISSETYVNAKCKHGHKVQVLSTGWWEMQRANGLWLKWTENIP